MCTTFRLLKEVKVLLSIFLCIGLTVVGGTCIVPDPETQTLKTRKGLLTQLNQQICYLKNRMIIFKHK